MESNSHRDDDKQTGLDTEDVSLPIVEEYFADPMSSDGSAPPPSHHLSSKSPKGNTTPSEQSVKAPDSAAAVRGQEYTELGSNVSCAEVPVTEKRHSKQASA